MRFSTLFSSALTAPCAIVNPDDIRTSVEGRGTVKDATRNQPPVAKVSAQVDMPPFAPSLVTLTLVLLHVASPRNTLLKTLAFTSHSRAPTLKTQHPPPSRLPSLLRTMLQVVPLARLHQVGYEISVVVATNATRRRTLGHPQRP